MHKGIFIRKQKTLS